MLSSEITKQIINKDKIKIVFFGKLDLTNGSDRVFCYTFSNYLCSIRFCIQFHFIDPNKLQFIMTKKPFIIPIRSYTLLCYRLFVIRREDEI